MNFDIHLIAFALNCAYFDMSNINMAKGRNYVLRVFSDIYDVFDYNKCQIFNC